MASSFTLYSKFREYMMNGVIDLETATIKLALVTSDYTPSIDHEVLADVFGSPSPEVEEISSPDNGYTAGGKTLTNVSVTKTDSPSQGTFDADDVTWTALTAVFRYGELYASGTFGGIEDPLIGYILYDTTPADITVSGVDWVNQWSANGIITN